MIHKKLLTTFSLLFLASCLSNYTLAKSAILAPQSTSCISSSFSVSGNENWQTISLVLTNTCGQPVDFQNSTITFLNTTNLNETFWGNFSPLSYPINTLQISSQPQAGGNYLASLSLQFPTYSGANSVLPNGKSFTIIYGAPQAGYIANSVNVYLGSIPLTGQINLTNATSQPANVSQNYALVNLSLNGQLVSSVQLPWSGQQQVSGLIPGVYTVSPVNVSDSNSNLYEGVANPATINLSAGQTSSSTVSYTPAQQTGSIRIQVQTLPSVLSGYTGIPVVTLTRTDTGGAVKVNSAWNATTTASQLANGVNYTFSTAAIVFNGYSCAPSFNPAAAIASVNSIPTTNLTYNCTQLAQSTVTVNVSGVSTTTTSVTLSFTANNNSTPINQVVNLTNGQGSTTVQLSSGTVYTVSSTSLSGYSVSYNPQPLTATNNATESIIYSPNSSGNSGRIIGYLPGWLTPPTATELANAGYTHILVAFGVFSTTNPGQITPAFDTVNTAYIQSLQAAGIKVLLSLGGASTSLANTTVSFNQALQLAPSAPAFQATFIQSLESLITQYGFDGFDFDIESGLNGEGSFANPQGDLAVLANIINTMHTNHPSLLLTLAPQTANISATQSFSAVWGNYASLIMQTHSSLEWVGIQLYNSGCMFGINLVCYDPNNTASPDFSVAMATDLLVNWPATTGTGQPTGFQPYISYLTPSQVVLGYVSPNAQGIGDGSPVIPNSTIKRAIQCLRTGVVSANSCDTYTPPSLYSNLGGVFDWQVNNDQNNQFGFAKGLTNCVKNDNCS